MMVVGRIIAIHCAVAASLNVPLDANAEPNADRRAGPPELGVAVAVNRHSIELRRFVERIVTRTTPPDVPRGVEIQVRSGAIEPPKTAETVPVIETHITRFDVNDVAAHRIDGRAISGKALLDLLARPVPVVVERPGYETDPVFLKMFKPEAIVLVLLSRQGPITAPR